MYVRLHAYTGLGSGLPANQKVQPQQNKYQTVCMFNCRANENRHTNFGNVNDSFKRLEFDLSANQQVQPQQIKFRTNLPK